MLKEGATLVSKHWMISVNVFDVTDLSVPTKSVVDQVTLTV